jgi:hypothetical protein
MTENHAEAAGRLLADVAQWAEKDARRNPGGWALIMPAQVQYALQAAQVHALLASAPAPGLPGLSADEGHVLLDVIGEYRVPPKSLPWTEYYDSDPAEDPKASEEGWKALLASATAKITEVVSKA